VSSAGEYEGIPPTQDFPQYPHQEQGVPSRVSHPSTAARLGGYLIDSIIIGVAALAIASLTGLVGGDGDGATAGPWVGVVCAALWIIARTGSEAAWGTTPGKRVIKAHVVGPDGGKPDVLTALKRNCWMVVNAIPFVFAGLIKIALSVGIGATIA